MATETHRNARSREITGDGTMALSGRSLEALMDLVEIKLDCVEIFDREDAREVKLQEYCHEELVALHRQRGSAEVIEMPRGRAARAQAV